MARFVGLDVSQKLTSVCVVDDTGRRIWRGQCASDPEQIARLISRHAGDAAGIGRSRLTLIEHAPCSAPERNLSA